MSNIFADKVSAERHLGRLIGYEITDVAFDEGIAGLVLQNDTKQQAIAWVLRDSEGNGPGWLEIQAEGDD